MVIICGDGRGGKGEWELLDTEMKAGKTTWGENGGLVFLTIPLGTLRGKDYMGVKDYGGGA